MHIDWFTFGAQAINFVILMWLLKRFLYKPILHAIDAREQLIAAELADAAATKAEAQKDRDEFQHKNEQFDQQRATLLSQATNEAAAERTRLFEEARKAANELKSLLQKTLKSDAENLNQALCRRTQQEVFAIARKTLTELASTSLEKQVATVFTDRLRSIDGPVKAELVKAVHTSSEPVLVRSAFDMPPEERSAIQTALNETFSAEVPVRFETTPDLISGVELTTNGQKVVWSIADYLVGLENGIDELLNKQIKPETSTQAKVDLTPASKG